MLRSFVLVSLLIALGLVQSSAQQYPVRRDFLLNQDIVALAKGGYDEPTIIATLLGRPNQFDMTMGALEALAAQGVSERILQAMLSAKGGHTPVDLMPGPRSQQEAEVVSPSAPPSPIHWFHSFLPGRRVHQRERAPIVLEQLPTAANGVFYEQPIATKVDGRCPNGNMSLSLADGALPSGLEVTSLGLRGTPNKTGKFLFTIQAANICVSVLHTFELVVSNQAILEVTPAQISFSCLTPEQAPAPIAMLVSSTWANLPYRLEMRDASWLHAVQERGITPPQDSAITADVVTLTADPSHLKPGTYHGSVLLWTRQGTNTQSIPVALVVGLPN
jgi:hypothetical protein